MLALWYVEQPYRLHNLCFGAARANAARAQGCGAAAQQVHLRSRPLAGNHTCAQVKCESYETANVCVCRRGYLAGALLLGVQPTVTIEEVHFTCNRSFGTVVGTQTRTHAAQSSQ